MYVVGDCKSEDEICSRARLVSKIAWSVIINACQSTWYAFRRRLLFPGNAETLLSWRGHIINKASNRQFWFLALRLFSLRHIFQRLEPVADTSNTREESHSHHSTMSRGTWLEASRLELESLSQSYRYRYQESHQTSVDIFCSPRWSYPSARNTASSFKFAQ